MTIITKTIINPKNEDGKGFPLMDDKCTVSIDVKDGGDSSGSTIKPAIRVCGTSPLYVLFWLTMFILSIYSLYLYAAYTDLNNESSVKHFKGWAEIPMPQYQEGNDLLTEEDQMNKQFDDLISRIFKEFVEIDDINENYEAIEVPDFDKIVGRFIHDFSTNYSAIIDPSKNRCFVMPLNRTAILPPRTLRDAINKIKNGYYDVDMTVVKQDYKALIPAVKDYSDFGPHISGECGMRHTYRLGKINRDIVKRSLQLPGKSAVYTHYGGKMFQEAVITNVADLEKYEADNF